MPPRSTAIVAIALTIAAPGRAADEEDGQATERAALGSRLERLGQEYGIVLRASDRAGESTRHYEGRGVSVITWQRLGESHLARYLETIEVELRRYPREFIGDVGLRSIVFCADLHHNGRAIQGVAALLEGVIYLNLRLPGGSPRHLARTFHHELFHMIDYRADRPRWREWAALAEATDPYRAFPPGPAGDEGWDLPAVGPKGYITNYAQSSCTEDRAELFAWKLIDPEAVDERLQGDPALMSKVQLLGELLDEFSPGSREIVGLNWEDTPSLSLPAAAERLRSH